MGDEHPENSVQFLLERLRHIAALVMYAAEANTLPEVLQRIAEVSAELVRARYAALGVPDGKGGLIYFEVFGITPEQIRRMEHPPIGKGLIGAIMHNQETLRLTRMKDDPRSVGFPAHHPTMTSLLGVPIRVGQHLLGMLYLSDRLDGKPFSEDDETLIETMAGYAALAIAGSELRDQQSRLTLLEERERIGMELHDGIIQALYAVGMNLELLRTSDRLDPGSLEPPIDNLNEVIEDIRGYIMNLKRRGDRLHTIREYLNDVVRRLHIPAGLKIEIDAPDAQMPFGGPLYDALSQMTNEALSNVIRHASAKCVVLHAYPRGPNFEVTIADDGKGFDPEGAEHKEGLGLRNIRQRARLNGGDVVIDSAPGKGTTVTILLPLPVSS
jgi:two-component system, NarL family, sensor histidine kinase DevS